ncbi:MAG: TonB family protein [Telluria sp.]
MKTALLFLAAAASILPIHADAARMPDPQQVMVLDLYACPRPDFPSAALAQRAEGKTTVEVQIGEGGNVTEARVLTSSGRADLDEAALASIHNCVFHAVRATGLAPTGWLKTQYVWVPGEAKKTQALDPALYASTKKLAAEGNPAAQNRLGTWYEHGTHVKVDLAQAAAWYRLAAQGGDAYAQNNLGVLYSRGAGVPSDPKQAVHWYAKAAAQGHGWGQANLAHYYQYGIAVERDLDKALHWLSKSAAGSLAAAQVRLGLLEMERAVIDADRSAAVAWIARAAAQDFPQGHYYLGRSFELGLGNVQDDAQAAALYRKTLGRSGGRGEVALGMLLEAGRASADDPEEVAKLYQKAMQASNPAAYYRYGLLLEQRGDDALAAAVFRQGAEMGDCDATLKHAQLRQAEGATAAAGTRDAFLEQRATSCAARPELPPRL